MRMGCRDTAVMGAASCVARVTGETWAPARPTTEVGTATGGVTTTTTGKVRTAATTATVGFSGPSQRGPGSHRDSSQYSKGPGENSSMFHGHGVHSVAGRLQARAALIPQM